MTSWNDRILTALETIAGGQAPGTGWNERVATSLEAIAIAAGEGLVTTDDLHGKPLDVSVATPNLYIPEAINDASVASTPLYSFGLVGGLPTVGWRETMTVVENVRVHKVLEWGTIVPAYYYSHAQDDDGGGISAGTSGSYRYKSLGSGEWVSWDVPAVAAGHDTLEVCYYRPYSTVSFAITIERDGETIVVGTYPEDAITHVAGSKMTITLPEALQTGDQIKLLQTGATNSMFLHSITTYQSDGVVDSATQHRKLVGETSAVFVDSSVLECVASMAPTGQTPKPVGGRHQSSTYISNALQTDVTESYVVDGIPYALAQGWKTGHKILMTRDSQVDYSAAALDIASMYEEYRLDGQSISYWQERQANEPLDVDSRYILMCPYPEDEVQNVYTDAGSKNIANTTDGDEIEFATSMSQAMADGIVDGALVCAKINTPSETPRRVMAWHNATSGYKKLYSKLRDVTNETFVQSAGWSVWLEAS